MAGEKEQVRDTTEGSGEQPAVDRPRRAEPGRTGQPRK